MTITETETLKGGKTYSSPHIHENGRKSATCLRRVGFEKNKRFKIGKVLSQF